jgi:general secretion pathway protein G
MVYGAIHSADVGQRAARSNSPRSAPGRRRAFTLVEILIVVIILGILASIVIPQFSSASHQARENTLKDDMRFLRSQVQVYRAQHRDVPPGYPGGDYTATPSETDFLDQMTLFSNELGSTGPARSTATPYGPYLSRMPPNPLNDQTTVYVISNGTPMPTAGSLPVMNGGVPYGWIYKPQTQEWMPNLDGSDSSGTPYANY